MRGERVSINGIDLYHEVHGRGRPLVVLHGGALNAETCFGAMIPRLAAGHQVIAVDLQGHGRTADTARPITLTNMASDVVGLLDHLGLDRADLFGFSLGSLVSIEMAVNDPARVGRLVLASGHIRPDGYHPEIQDPDQMGVSPRLPTEEDFAAMKAAYEATAPHPEQFFPVLEKLQPVVSEFEGWPDAAIRGIAGPTLLIVGDQDFVRLEHAARMLELFPDAQLAVLPGTTHMQVIRRTEAVLALVEPFLDGPPDSQPVGARSARNRFPGIVTRVVRDTVMAQVELQVGPHRVVSLISREAADELELAPGVTAVATVKATNVVIELPAGR